MNREILFRGKRIDNGEWVEGYLRFGPDMKDAYIGCFVDYIDEGLHTDYLEFRVFSATIGQYTGLTDKNGKRIFEGDLITTAWWHGHVAKIVFNNGMFKAGYIPLFSWVALKTYEVAVVGNVWENPELMEGD